MVLYNGQIIFYLQKFIIEIDPLFIKQILIEIYNYKFLNKNKRMISQSANSKTLKCQQNDYTNVSTQNSSQHSVDTSFQEKSSENDYVQKRVLRDEELEVCPASKMEEQSQVEQKQTKIQFFKKSVEWLGRKYKRFKVRTQTLYLAISYLTKYINICEQLKYRHELLSAVCLLLASKFNQIHFPSIKSIIGSLEFASTKRQIVQTQQQLVEMFDFQMCVQRNSYSIIHQVFKFEEEQKRKNAEKLLFLAISNQQTLQFDEAYLGFSIVYLLKPQALKNYQSINRDSMKKTAFIVYKMYKEKKAQQNKQSSSS